MRLIRRNAFAREELMSESVKCPPATTCYWCGGLNKRKRLYRYWVESDSGRISPFRGYFCGISCARAYHDGL